MIVLIDNFDSFSYNLVQAMSSQGADVKVFRNNEITVDEIVALKPKGIVISPGPCTPKEAGISVEVARSLAGKLPILGVCLGHQSIAAAFGATVSNASQIMHGKVSPVTHDKSDLYRGIKSPFPAGRYHSLSVVRSTLPEEFIIDATSADDEIMGMHHVEYKLYGVQFHPESVLTPSGKRLLRNFLQITGELEQRT